MNLEAKKQNKLAACLLSLGAVLTTKGGNSVLLFHALNFTGSGIPGKRL
jgi:hypothetical protein